MEPPSVPTWSHRIEDVLVGGISRLLRFLPEPLALALGSALGWTAGSVLGIRRRTILENLSRAFPNRSGRWRRRVARRVMPHVAREGVTLLRLAALGPEEVRRRTVVSGLERVRSRLKEGRGVLILTGHLGNWEIGGSALAVRDIPLDVVARRQKNPLFDERIRQSREGLGMSVVYRDEAPRRVLRSLRGGRAVALVADQNVHRGGIFVDFFGTAASTVRGPAVFALRTGAPVFLGVARRLPGWRARYQVALTPLELPDMGDLEQDAHILTRRYMAALEDAIREIPEQYFWLHKRWKTRPKSGASREEPDGLGSV